jgi:hypothetical protein
MIFYIRSRSFLGHSLVIFGYFWLILIIFGHFLDISWSVISLDLADSEKSVIHDASFLYLMRMNEIYCSLLFTTAQF